MGYHPSHFRLHMQTVLLEKTLRVSYLKDLQNKGEVQPKLPAHQMTTATIIDAMATIQMVKQPLEIWLPSTIIN